MKLFEDALLPDDRQRAFLVDDPMLGLRAADFADHHAMVASLTLPDGIPPKVGQVYARALSTLVYSWFDYELAVVAVGQALGSLEFGLKLRVGERSSRISGLKGRLKLAVEEGLITAPSASAWGDTHYLLGELRNEIAHGTAHVYMPSQATQFIGHCRDLLSALFVGGDRPAAE